MLFARTYVVQEHQHSLGLTHRRELFIDPAFDALTTPRVCGMMGKAV